MSEREYGKKHDGGKPKLHLLGSLWPSIEQVTRVLEHGARKYEAENWQHVKDEDCGPPTKRYLDALGRHYFARLSGEVNDEESGLPHLAHAACCCLFLLWFEMKAEASSRA